MPKQFYTCSEISALTGFTRRAIIWKCKNGKIEAYKTIVPGQPKEIWAIPPTEALRFIEENKKNR